MPLPKDYTIWLYRDTDAGQIQVGTVTSPWIDVNGVSSITVQGVVTNGTGATVITVERSNDGVTVDNTSGDLFASITAGSTTSVQFRWARIKVTQTTAATTAAKLAAKGSD